MVRIILKNLNDFTTVNDVFINYLLILYNFSLDKCHYLTSKISKIIEKCIHKKPLTVYKVIVFNVTKHLMTYILF